MLSDELLLRAALSRDPAAATAAWEEWSLAVPVPSPAALRLFPLVYRNLRSLGVAEEKFAPRCLEIYRGTWIRNGHLLREATGLVGALAKEGIACIVLKGAALIASYYRDHGVRPMLDLDLLVRPSDTPAAAALLDRLGWHARLPFDASGMGVRHGCEFIKGEWGCDLHWSVFWETLDRTADDRLWRFAQEASLDGTPIMTLSPEHQLIHLAVHGTRRSEGANVRWIADAVTVLRSTTDHFNWDFFTAEVHAKSFQFPVGEALDYIRVLFQAPVPEGVLADLLRTRPSRLQRGVYTIALDKVDDTNPLGFVAPLWYKFLRQSRGGALQRALWFPRNLQYAWNVPRLRGLPAEILQRAARKAGQIWKAWRNVPFRN